MFEQESIEQARARVESEEGRVLSFRLELQMRLAQAELSQEEDPDKRETAVMEWIAVYGALFQELFKEREMIVRAFVREGRVASALSTADLVEWQSALDARARHSIH